MKWAISALFLLALAAVVHASSYSWPTPASTPSAFVGVTVIATPAPTPILGELCFQEFGPAPTYSLVQPTTCGQNFTVTANDIVCTGISIGPPQSSGEPSGPFPSTVQLNVNSTAYKNVPVNSSTGLIGCDLIVGQQIIYVQLIGQATFGTATSQIQSQ
jgi:hypothetical protein